MWKYLAFNTLWFFILFFAHFTTRKEWRWIVLTLILSSAVWTCFKGLLDPIGWFFYVLSSLAAFWSAGMFKLWAFARLNALNEEVGTLSKRLALEHEELAAREEETGLLDEKANRISHLYDKMKEMSGSLDRLETFLVFGQALSKYLAFDAISLAVFEDEEQKDFKPKEYYELRFSEFEELFDSSILLKNRKRAIKTVTEKDMRVLDAVRRELGTVESGHLATATEDVPRFIAHPIFLGNKIFAILILWNVRQTQNPVLAILTERFMAEFQRVKLYERIETLAITDGLTGVYVRRHLLERFQGEVDRCDRFSLNLSCLMIDIDYFKDFNDKHGHLVGDVVLKQVAETIRKSVRELDLVGRYGGEEFIVLLIETDVQGALFVAERIRLAIQEKRFRAYDENLQVTVSVGSSSYSSGVNTVSAMIEGADAALYDAKRTGRNKVCEFHELPAADAAGD